MLQSLYIRNYALIDELHIDFVQGLNIITGETGAGKSILLGALGLIMGERADSKAVKLNADKCIVEGNFKIDQYALNAFFEEHDLDYHEELQIRREVAASGKSRAFVNDTPVTLDILGGLMVQLVDIHQQFDTVAIFKENYQRAIIDALADNAYLLNEYQTDYRAYRQCVKSIEQLKEEAQAASQALTFNQFLLDELDSLNPKSNEFEDLSHELDLLSSVEDIKRVSQLIYQAADQHEQSILPVLTELAREARNLGSKDPRFKEIASRLQSSREELKDIANEAEAIFEQSDLDPKRSLFVQDRLAALHKAIKKHDAADTNALIAIHTGIREKVADLGNSDQKLASLEASLVKLLSKVNASAVDLSKSRAKVIPSFTSQIMNELALLGMKNAIFEVALNPINFQPHGADEVIYHFNANKGGKLLPLKDAASGGELSRLILVVKSIIAKSIHLPTMIFDEIDTGVSGEIAIRMGQLLQSLSKNHQLISITHSPHVASHGHAHLYVYKYDEKDITKSAIKILTKEERIEEIAKMLGGNPPSATAVANAKELLGEKVL